MAPLAGRNLSVLSAGHVAISVDVRREMSKFKRLVYILVGVRRHPGVVYRRAAKYRGRRVTLYATRYTRLQRECPNPQVRGSGSGQGDHRMLAFRC